MNPDISLEQATKQFDSTLQSLSYYYKNLVADHEHIADYARQQLDHVEALLKGKKSSTPKSSGATIKSIPDLVAPDDQANSVPSAPKSQPKAAKSAGKSTKPQSSAKLSSEEGVSLKLQKSYQGKTMLGAIEQVLQSQKGDAINTDEVVQALYGKLKPDLYKVAKDRVTKSLSKGKLEGKWERMPDRLGYYRLAP